MKWNKQLLKGLEDEENEYVGIEGGMRSVD